MCQIWEKGEKICSGHGFFIKLCYDLKIGSRSQYTTVIHKLCLFEIWAKKGLVKSICHLKKKDFFTVRNYLDPWPSNFIQSHCKLFDHRHYVNEVWALDWTKRREDMQTRIFFYNSALTLDQKTWFKITAHSIPKCTLWVKHEPK